MEISVQYVSKFLRQHPNFFEEKQRRIEENKKSRLERNKMNRMNNKQKARTEDNTMAYLLLKQWQHSKDMSRTRR